MGTTYRVSVVVGVRMTCKQYLSQYYHIIANGWRSNVHSVCDENDADLIVGDEIADMEPKCSTDACELKVDDASKDIVKSKYSSLVGHFGVWMIPVVC